MDRRKFLGWVGIGLMASSLPVVIVACNNQNGTEPPLTTIPDDEGFIKVGNTTELDQQGYILNQDITGSEVIVIRNPAHNEQLQAFNPTCPHTGCIVNWENEETKFICPCHGSQFADDGSFLEGPAQESLTSYELKLEGKEIFVKIV